MIPFYEYARLIGGIDLSPIHYSNLIPLRLPNQRQRRKLKRQQPHGRRKK